MSGLWLQIGLVIVLVLVNAAFSGTEMALVSLREGQLQRLEEESRRGAMVADLARDPNRFLATIQIGITLAGFLASAAAAVSLAEPLEAPLSFLGGAAGPASIVIVTLFLSYLTLVFGELAPKRVALQKAEGWALRMARPMTTLSIITTPIVWLLSLSSNLAVRLMGGDPKVQREEVTAEELREMVAAQSTFTTQQRQILDGAFEIEKRALKEILVPRPEVFVLDAAWTGQQALDELAASGHSRAPVAPDRSLDQVTGVVHLRHLLAGVNRPVAELVSTLPVFPDTAGALDTLRRLQDGRTQMALVIDEHGGAEGIVTVEDLLEELVGEIWDETDKKPTHDLQETAGQLTLPGQFPMHDLPDLDIELPGGDYTTIGGLVIDRLGRMPEPGDTVEVGQYALSVEDVKDRAITEVVLERLALDQGVDDET
jgi:putative hemolysin